MHRAGSNGKSVERERRPAVRAGEKAVAFAGESCSSCLRNQWEAAAFAAAARAMNSSFP